jgi:hypothetical protein
VASRGRRPGIAQAARPVLEKQPGQQIVRPVGDAALGTGPQPVPGVRELLGALLTLVAEALDGPLERLVHQLVEVVVAVEHRGRRDPGLLGDIPQPQAFEAPSVQGAQRGLVQLRAPRLLVLAPSHDRLRPTRVRPDSLMTG